MSAKIPETEPPYPEVAVQPGVEHLHFVRRRVELGERVDVDGAQVRI